MSRRGPGSRTGQDARRGRDDGTGAERVRPRRPPEEVESLLRAKLHVANLLERQVPLTWIAERAGTTWRQIHDFTSGCSIHRFTAAFAESLLAISEAEAARRSAATPPAWHASWSDGRVRKAARLREEVARDMEVERGRRVGMVRRALLPLPAVTPLGPRRTLIVGADERPTPGEAPAAAAVLAALRSSYGVPMRRVLRPAADVLKARGRATVGADPPGPGQDVQAPAGGPPAVVEADPGPTPVLLVRPFPAAPLMPAAARDPVERAVLESLCDCEPARLEDACRRWSDAVIAKRAGLAVADVAQWRDRRLLPAARCSSCRDRLAAPGRRSMCDQCAFEAHDRMARRIRHGVPPPPRDEARPEAPWPDASMPRAAPRPAQVHARAPSLERCPDCLGSLGTRRDVCGACAFDRFLAASAMMAEDGVAVE